MKLNWNFLGGGVVQNKKTCGGLKYGYFLELHMIFNIYHLKMEAIINVVFYSVLKKIVMP